MRFIESTKHIVTVGTSVGVTLGVEAERMRKAPRDEIGVIVFEPELMDEAVALLDHEYRGRYFIIVRKESSVPDTEIVYDISVSSIKAAHGDLFAILGPFDNLRSCVKFKRIIDRDPPGEAPDDYQNAYYEFVTD